MKNLNIKLVLSILGVVLLQACTSMKPSNDSDYVDLTSAVTRPHTIFDKEVVASPVEELVKPVVAEVTKNEIEAQTPTPAVREPATAAEENFLVYTVKEGDSLYRISRITLGKTRYWKQFLSWNQELADKPGKIRPGMQIRYPASFQEPQSELAGDHQLYVVKKKDTLSRIAKKLYGKSYKWKELSSWNKDILSSPHKLKVGMKIKYHESERSPASLKK